MSIIIAALLAGLNPCEGSTTRDVEQCLAAEFARADVLLNRYYVAAVGRLTKEKAMTALAKLRASERAWITYRDVECGAVYEWWKEGTIRGAMALGCKTKLTKARTMAVWQNWLTYADNTPPLLPMPDIQH